ncbi:zeta toxin family protein [Enterococcus sp.]|uniref:zeta toxin family protein n=1 Tax=Enterococcus sp. TaxID=35783 RepID=UPI002FC8ACD1
MKKYLILLAGSPGTGKTYLLNQLKKQFSEMFVITPDEAKEYYAESIGFDNLECKKQLEDTKVWPFYYNVLNWYMDAGKKLIVSEYPFSDKQKGKLTEMSEKHGYQVITIRLVGDFETLWTRRFQRDREPERHLSFIMDKYHYGDTLENRNNATNHITKEDFHKIVTEREYDQFELGKLYEIDVSDFSKVDYKPLLNTLQEEIEG